MQVNEKDLLIVSHLRQDARVKLTDMSKSTRIPVSTLFDKIRTYEGGIIKKHTALVDFTKLGYQAKALIIFSASKKDRQKLLELLAKNSNVNSLYRINNEWDYMAETIFPGIKEVEDFLEEVEEKVKLRNKKILYIIDEIRKEQFLSQPERLKLIHVGSIK